MLKSISNWIASLIHRRRAPAIFEKTSMTFTKYFTPLFDLLKCLHVHQVHGSYLIPFTLIRRRTKFLLMLLCSSLANFCDKSSFNAFSRFLALHRDLISSSLQWFHEQGFLLIPFPWVTFFQDIVTCHHHSHAFFFPSYRGLSSTASCCIAMECTLFFGFW